MLFASLQNRLITHIRERVRSGELTERGLARMAGMSQPHLHNVLKGVRSLSVEYADQILVHLQLSVSDLLSAVELDRLAPVPQRGLTMEIPRLPGSAGPSCFLEPHPYPGDLHPVAKLLADQLTDPILITLGDDPLLFPHFQEGDLALITRPFVTAVTLDPSSVYLVKTLEGTLVRSLRFGGTRLYLITPSTMDEPRNWDVLPLRGQQLSDVIVGKLVWFGRQLKAEPFRPSRYGVSAS